MTISLSHYQAPSPSPQRQEPDHSPAAQDAPADSLVSVGLDAIVRALSKVVASDVAQVGDLMINGRHDTILAERPPATE